MNDDAEHAQQTGHRSSEPEPLETGWGAATPLGDNLVHTALANLADGLSHYARALGGREHRTAAVSLGDLDCPAPLFNDAVLLEPVLDAAAPVLDEVDAFFGDHRSTGAIVWSGWPTPDLTCRGWDLVGYPPLMLLPAARPPMAPGPSELVVEHIGDGAGMAAFEEVLVNGFPLEELVPYQPGCIFDERVLGGPFRAWVGRVEGQAVAASAAHVFGGVTMVEWVVTLPGARGRGYGRAMTEVAALCEPDQPALLNSSDAGRPVYERMGFLTLLRFTLWHRPGPAARTG